MVEETSDAELIERARRLYRGSPPHGQCEKCQTLRQLADRLTALTTPKPWRSPSDLPALLDLVFVRIGKDCVEIGYHTEECICGWADCDGRVLCGVTGWKPIVRPLH